jgi:hypothetical protein
MTALSRVLVLLIAAALGACAFLPWFADVTALRLPLGSLLDPAANSGGQAVTSIGAVVLVAAVIVLFAAIASSRVMLIVGALLALLVSATWILVRVLEGVAVARIGPGAYGAVVCALMALILAAVATDTRVPTVR